MPLHFSSRVQAAETSKLVSYLAGFQELDAVRVYKQQSTALLLRQLKQLAQDRATRQTAELRVLEVGCGLGDDVAELADATGEETSFVGLDHNADLLELAEQRHARRSNLRFVHGPLTAMPLADESFAVCRADRVLQHVPDVAAAMREMYRVLRPDGSILLLDTDWDTLVVDSGHPATTRTVCDSFRAGIVQPRIGRELSRHCRAAGFRVVDIHANTLLFREMAVAERVIGLSDAALSAMDAAALDAEAVVDWITSLRAQSERGEFFSAVTGFAVCAVKGD